MKKIFGGPAIFLDRADINTDEIIPAKYLTEVTKEALKPYCLEDLKLEGFDPKGEKLKNAQVVITRENFGCGSSREHAVWALHEYGIRVVIAPSFSPIFRGNCVRNGIVPVALAAEEVARLAEFVTADPSAHQLEVDLVTCEVRAGTRIKKFELESEAREMLLEGLDGIDLTLKHRADIDAFVTRDRLERPWIYSTVEKPRA